MEGAEQRGKKYEIMDTGAGKIVSKRGTRRGGNVQTKQRTGR